MHWFYVNTSQIDGDFIKIKEESVNHMKNVLRMKVGERLVLCNQEGTDYLCEIASIKDDEILAKILSTGDSEGELPVKITLFQGLPKKDKMEFIIQKAVELGVFEIVPVAMKRCVAKIEDSKKEEKKLARWRQIAESAAEQSQRGMVPRVHSVVDFNTAVKMAKEMEHFLFPYEQAEGMEFSKKIIKDAARGESVAVMIGPEGGFDDSEVMLAKENGGKILSLGRRILRTETAGMTTLSILMFEIESGR